MLPIVVAFTVSALTGLAVTAGACRLMLAFIPGMRETGGGHILNILTMGCQVKTPRFAAYIASKAALDAAARCVSTEIRQDGVKLTQVYLPLVRTPMISPTKLYDDVRAMKATTAAKISLEPIITGQPRVSMPFGVVAELFHALAPELTLKLLNRIYLKTPDSNEEAHNETPKENRILNWVTARK